jgi:UDP-N-acetylmuramate-alanine ligase
VLWLADFDAAERTLGALLGEGDLCLVLGAGDVDELGRRLVLSSAGVGGASRPGAARESGP